MEMGGEIIKNQKSGRPTFWSQRVAKFNLEF